MTRASSTARMYPSRLSWAATRRRRRMLVRLWAQWRSTSSCRASRFLSFVMDRGPAWGPCPALQRYTGRVESGQPRAHFRDPPSAIGVRCLACRGGCIPGAPTRRGARPGGAAGRGCRAPGGGPAPHWGAQSPNRLSGDFSRRASKGTRNHFPQPRVVCWPNSARCPHTRPTSS